jgi:hypothetical protein
MMEIIERFRFWRRVHNYDAPIWRHWSGDEVKVESYNILSDMVTSVHHNYPDQEKPHKKMKRSQFLSLGSDGWRDVNPIRRRVF